MTPDLLFSLFFSLFFSLAISLRCYTDVAATKSLSVECGMSTGCLKIYKKAAQFDSGGVFIPPHKRSQDLQLFRGCFLVSTADTCHDSSSNGLSYCWCSHTDLCNRVDRVKYSVVLLTMVLTVLLGLCSDYIL
eukprot:TRINITY_DN77225_c0_g1_i1.p1 TRINITY_DN77225_c0_g1~~TRINITY_DN77225_c0_g1_i1.p1  ORF type:complete len:133 (+),score=9.43 TRINITY_DN77225_c0_g1_i1:156-554(+)